MAELESLNNISKHGGARPGAGHPKGKKTKTVLEREAAAKVFKERVAKNVDRLFNAQLDLAVGEKYLMLIETTGKGVNRKRTTSIVTDIEIIKRFLDEDLDNTETEYYFMTTKPANNQALEGMLNRSFGKAKESIDLTSGGQPMEALVKFVNDNNDKPS